MLQEKQTKTLRQALEVVGLSKSSFFYRPRLRAPRPIDSKLVRAIGEVRKGYAEVYGVRRIHAALKARGFSVNRKKVFRHLKALGITQPRKVKGQRWSHPARISPPAANLYWEMDFTYTWMGSGNSYLCIVVDAWDRDVVGDVFSERCRAEEACLTLERAVMNRFGERVPEGHRLALRVDRGSQFISRRFREAARALNVQLEYAGVRCPEDKPYVESFIGSYKTEEVYRREYGSLAGAREGWQSYKTWYRTARLHQSLGYKSPKAFFEQAQAGFTQDHKQCMASFRPV